MSSFELDNIDFFVNTDLLLHVIVSFPLGFGSIWLVCVLQ